MFYSPSPAIQAPVIIRRASTLSRRLKMEEEEGSDGQIDFAFSKVHACHNSDIQILFEELRSQRKLFTRQGIHSGKNGLWLSTISLISAWRILRIQMNDMWRFLPRMMEIAFRSIMKGASKWSALFFFTADFSAVMKRTHHQTCERDWPWLAHMKGKMTVAAVWYAVVLSSAVSYLGLVPEVICKDN